MTGVATTWVALLRGINVGKAKRLAMADLRSLLEGPGYESPKTLLNSGNAVFEAKGTEQAIVSAVRGGIEGELGMNVKAMVRSATEMATPAAAFPNANPKAEPNRNQEDH